MHAVIIITFDNEQIMLTMNESNVIKQSNRSETGMTEVTLANEILSAKWPISTVCKRSCKSSVRMAWQKISTFVSSGVEPLCPLLSNLQPLSMPNLVLCSTTWILHRPPIAWLPLLLYERVDKHAVQNDSSRCCFAHKVLVCCERGDYNFSLIGRNET